jgi:hypothetical protein
MSVRGPGRVVCGGRSRFGGLAWSGACKQHSIHETGARTDDAIFTPGRSSPPSVVAAPARCGAFADERRIVPGDGSGRETLIAVFGEDRFVRIRVARL